MIHLEAVVNHSTTGLACCAARGVAITNPIGEAIMSEGTREGQCVGYSRNSYKFATDIVYFPVNGRTFASGPYFTKWKLFCAARDNRTEITSTSALVNQSVLAVSTLGSLSDIIRVEVVRNTSSEMGGYAQLRFGPIDNPEEPWAIYFTSSDWNAAIPSSSPYTTLTSQFYTFYPGDAEKDIYFIGQADGNSGGDKEYDAVLRLSGTNDPRFAHVPEYLNITTTLRNKDWPEKRAQMSDSLSDSVGLNLTASQTKDFSVLPTSVLIARLKSEPQGSVFFGISIVDETPCIIVFPSLLVFSPDNWNSGLHIYMDCTSSSSLNGTWTLSLMIHESEDPRYLRSHELVNQDVVAGQSRCSSIFRR